MFLFAKTGNPKYKIVRHSYRDLLTASKVLLMFTLSWLKDPVVYQLRSQYTPVINGNILLY